MHAGHVPACLAQRNQLRYIGEFAAGLSAQTPIKTAPPMDAPGGHDRGYHAARRLVAAMPR